MQVTKTGVHHLAVLVRSSSGMQHVAVVEPQLSVEERAGHARVCAVVCAVLSHGEEHELRFDIASMAMQFGWSVRWLGPLADPSVRRELQEAAGEASVGLVFAAVNAKLRADAGVGAGNALGGWHR